MSYFRTRIMILGLGINAIALTISASAQDFPTRTVRIIVPTSPGAHSDVTARSIAQALAIRIGQAVVVENRAGGGTMIGSEMVAKAAPDGHTLLMGGPSLAINPSIYKTVPYDSLRDFVPISLAIKQSQILVVHPSLPAGSVQELIALAKMRPSAIEFASPGTGSGPHLAMELFLVMSGTRMLHVPYKGPSQAFVDLTAGRVFVMMPSFTVGSLHVQAGRLRALAVSGIKRNAAMPKLPTIDEAGMPGYESAQWSGLLAPAATPKQFVDRLHKEVVAVLQMPDFQDSARKLDSEVIASSPQEFGSYIRAEMKKWAQVAAKAGLDPQ